MDHSSVNRGGGNSQELKGVKERQVKLSLQEGSDLRKPNSYHQVLLQQHKSQVTKESSHCIRNSRALPARPTLVARRDQAGAEGS